MVKLVRKTTKYVLGVIPGERRLILANVKALLGATHIGFASKNDAERLGGSVVGTILPFSFDPSLETRLSPEMILE
jgi:Ala-tRNA(Pro) deacylase